MAASALGLDGCAGGWFAILLVDGVLEGAGHVAAARAAIDRWNPTAVGVDIPVGLTDGAEREADTAARAMLRSAAASVFNAPPRVVVDGWRVGEIASYAKATARCVEVTGKGLSRQSWHLVPRIAEVDALAAAGVGPLEVHPELAFRLLAGGKALPGKRTWSGVVARRRLLAEAGVELPGSLPDGQRAAPDDVLDAAVAAWTAAGFAAGESLQHYPAKPGQFDHGRPVVIWARPRPPHWAGLSDQARVGDTGDP